MKNWKTLDLERLESFKKEIELTRKEDSGGQINKVGEYYQYLVENDHEYGSLAYLAATNTGIEGRYANNYLTSIAKKHNVEMTEELRQEIMLDLALVDIKERSKADGGVIFGQVIRKYHEKVLDDRGLPPEAWTGHFFEGIGPSAFMLGQGSVEQNEGNFTVQNINDFIKRSTETGSEAHLSMANFTGTALDNVLCKTLCEASPLETVRFLQNFSSGLQGNMLGLVTQDTVKLATQIRTRSNYKQAFKAKEKETSRSASSPGLSAQDEKEKIEAMMLKSMEKEAAMYRKLVKSAAYLEAKAYVEGEFFQKIFPDLDPIQEAKIEYKRIHDQEMPEELEQQLSPNKSPSPQNTSEVDQASTSEVPRKDAGPSVIQASEAYIKYTAYLEKQQTVSNMQGRTGGFIKEVLSQEKAFIDICKPSLEELNTMAAVGYTPLVLMNPMNTDIEQFNVQLSDNKKEVQTEESKVDAQDDVDNLNTKTDGIASQEAEDNNPHDTTEQSTASGGFFSTLFSFFGSTSESPYEADDMGEHEVDMNEQSRSDSPVESIYTSYRSSSPTFFASSYEPSESSSNTVDNSSSVDNSSASGASFIMAQGSGGWMI